MKLFELYSCPKISQTDDSMTVIDCEGIEVLVDLSRLGRDVCSFFAFLLDAYPLTLAQSQPCHRHCGTGILQGQEVLAIGDANYPAWR